MADFATLVLSADSRGLVQGEKALNSLAATAEKTEGRTAKAAKGLADAHKEVGKQSIFAGQQSRMVALQLSQVAQQASATGDWVRALAIQLPDLTLGFGTIGIAAGVAAGAILPLVANLLTGQEEGEKFSDTMDSLGEAIDGYRDATQKAIAPASELIDKFGMQAEGAFRVYEAMRKIKEIEFNQALRNARDAIKESLSGIQESIDRYNLASTSFMRPEAITAVHTEVENLKNQFGLTLVQATRINDALDQMAAASGPHEIADAAMRLGNEFSRAVEEGANLSPALEDVQKSAYQAAQEALEFAHLIDQSTGGANALAGAVGGVADEAARAAQNAAALVDALRTQAVTAQLVANGGLNQLNAFRSTPFQTEQDIMNDRAENTKSQYQIAMERLAKSQRKGRGTKKISDEAREAKRIFDETRTAAEKYQQELDDLNELHRMGYLDADTYARAVKKVGDEYRDASEQGKFFNEISDDLKNGILDAILEGKNLADVFQSVAKSIARAALEAALFGSGPFAGNNKGGGILSGLFSLFKLPSADGGGYTGTSSRSGGIDGKGGFLSVLHPQETVIDHTKPGMMPAMQGGNQYVNITTPPGDTAEQKSTRRGNDQFLDVVIKRTGDAYGLKRPVTQT